MCPTRIFLAAAAAVALGGVLEAAFGPEAPAALGPALLAGPEGPMAAFPADGWCPSPPDAFAPCGGGPDRIRIRPATAAEAGLLSGGSGPAAPWRLEGWAARAAALGLRPEAGDAPDADLSADALAAATRLPPSTFLAAVPAGGVPGAWRATLDLSRSDSGPFPWRLILQDTRLHAGRAWTLQAEIWSPQAPDARTLARARAGVAAVLGAIDAPAAPDPARRLWAQIARPDGDDVGEQRARPISAGWRLEGLAEDGQTRERLAKEAAPLRSRLIQALADGAAEDDLVLAFARAAIRASDGPPGPTWRPAAAACGRGLPLGDGIGICLLPDGRAAATRDMPDGTRLVQPLARVLDVSAPASPVAAPH